MMDINKFYWFKSKTFSRNFVTEVVGLEDWSEINGISQYNCLIGGEYDTINFPVIFKHAEGKRMTDLLEAGWPSLYHISDRVKSVFEENGLTGWKTFPMRILDKKG